MQKGAKARALISINSSQPVDRVKEIDPIDGHRTTTGQSVRQDRDPDSYPSTTSGRPFKGKGWLGAGGSQLQKE